EGGSCSAGRRGGRASSRSDVRGYGCVPSGCFPAPTCQGSRPERARIGRRAYLLPSTVYEFQISSLNLLPTQLVQTGELCPILSLRLASPVRLFGKRSAAPEGEGRRK